MKKGFTRIEFDTEYAEAHYNYGLALAGQREFSEAESQSRAAVRLSARLARAHVNLANLMVMRGDMAQAIDHYRIAIRTDDTLVAAHLNLATALLSQDNPREARPHLERVVTLDPQHLHGNLGSAFRAWRCWRLPRHSVRPLPELPAGVFRRLNTAPMAGKLPPVRCTSRLSSASSAAPRAVRVPC